MGDFKFLHMFEHMPLLIVKFNFASLNKLYSNMIIEIYS